MFLNLRKEKAWPVPVYLEKAWPVPECLEKACPVPVLLPRLMSGLLKAAVKVVVVVAVV